jgi:hypothetical protein
VLYCLSGADCLERGPDVSLTLVAAIDNASRTISELSKIPYFSLRTSGPGGGGDGGAPAHADPIFVPSDLRVWSLSLLLSIAAGIMPAWKASRLSPLEALRRT